MRPFTVVPKTQSFGNGVGVRYLTKCRFTLTQAAEGEFGASPCGDVSWCLVGGGKKMVRPRCLCVARFQTIFLPGKCTLRATLRHGRSAGLLGIGMRRIRLLNLTNHAPVVRHRRLPVHADVQVVPRLYTLDGFPDGLFGVGVLVLNFRLCRIRSSGWWMRMKAWCGLGSRMLPVLGILGIGRRGLFQGDGICGFRGGRHRDS